MMGERRAMQEALFYGFSHIISTLRAVSRSKRRLDWTWLT
jgi:hypothetical protein